MLWFTNHYIKSLILITAKSNLSFYYKDIDFVWNTNNSSDNGYFYLLLNHIELKSQIHLRNSICSLSIFRFLKDGNSNVTLRLFCSICWLRISSVHLQKIALHRSYIMVESYMYSILYRMLLLRLQKYICNHTEIY